MKRIVFIQSFHISQPVGGAVIMKKLISHAKENSFEPILLLDSREVPEEYKEFEIDGKIEYFDSIDVLTGPISRHLRYLKSFFNLDKKRKNQLIKLLEKYSPDIIHIVAHSVKFPFYSFAARGYGKAEIRISIHDLWTLTISNRFPSFLNNYIFKKSLLCSNIIFPISIEMGNYMRDNFSIICKEPVHDGFEITSRLSKKASKELKILFAGNINSEQELVFLKLLQNLDLTLSEKITFIFCANTVLKINTTMIEIQQLGWKSQEDLELIASDCSFGIMALSFNKTSTIFNNTSFMTKVPFYLNMCLPIIYVGPSNTSAYNFIQKNNVGIIHDNDNFDDLRVNILKNKEELHQASFQENIINCLINELNIKQISSRFYS